MEITDILYITRELMRTCYQRKGSLDNENNFVQLHEDDALTSLLIAYKVAYCNSFKFIMIVNSLKPCQMYRICSTVVSYSQ